MSDAVVKTVGKKLKYYFDVKRLEDGFDLSGVHSPQLDHPPLKSRPTLQYDGLHDRALKHYFSLPEVRVRLTKMDIGDEYTRETTVRRKLKKSMLKYNFLPTTLPEYCYVDTKEGRKLNREMIEFQTWYKNAQKNKPLKGGWPLLRSVPARSMSKGEAQRLVTAATKILIATEAVDRVMPPRSTKRPQSAPSPFETNKSLPSTDQHEKKKLRPTPGKYTWDIHGRRHRNVKVKGRNDESADSAYTTRTSSFSSDHQKKKKEEQKPVKLQDEHIDDIFLSPPVKPHPPPKRQIHIINRDTPAEEEILTTSGTQTQDNVGIQTEKRLIVEHDPDEEEVRQGDWGEYQIYVKTGDTIGASTKADVKMTVYGDKGRSKEFYLDRSKRHKITFQKGKEDLFMKAFPHVGKLKKIKIGHDRMELSYAWFLESVTIYDMKSKRVYDFICNKWLSGQDGDRKTYRVLQMTNDRAFIEKLVDESDTEKRRRHHSNSSSSSSTASSVSSHDEDKNKNTKISVLVQSSSRRDDGSDSDSSVSSSSSSSSSTTTTEKQSNMRASSPLRATEKDEFFDSRGQGPTTFTFREHVSHNDKHDDSSTETSTTPKHIPVETSSETSSSTRPEQEFLHGYKVGLEAVQEENRQKKDNENEERKKILRGPTIHSAAKIGSMKRVQELLQYFPEMMTSRDEKGFTPLHVASKSGQLEVVKWLAVNGASLNEETPTGYTPIHLAAMTGQVNCLMVLAALGAAITCRSTDKKTPLFLAAMEGHLECVKWLIANRARLDVKDDMGRTPRQVALEFGHKSVADFLKTCEDDMRDPYSGFAQMRTNEYKNDENSSPKETKDMWKDDEKLATGESDSEDEKSRSSQKDLEEKRKIYDQQHKKMDRTGESFLDSIRQELSPEP